MKQRKKATKLLSILLGVCLLVSNTAPAFAANTEDIPLGNAVSQPADHPQTDGGTDTQPPAEENGAGDAEAPPSDGAAETPQETPTDQPPEESDAPSEETPGDAPTLEPAPEPEPDSAAPEQAVCTICGGAHPDSECPAAIQPLAEVYALTEADLDGGWEGSGTEADPWLIQTPEDLKMLSDKNNELSQLNNGNGNPYSKKYFLQTNDISLKQYDNWRAIAAIWGGTKTTAFFGADYNGNGHEITDMTITSLDAENNDVYASLFGRGAGCVIRNLGVSGTVNVAGNETGGMLSMIQNGKIINCYSKVMVNNSATNSYANAGVLSGRIDDSEVTNCYVFGAVNCARDWVVGFIAGQSITGTNSVVKDCFYANDVQTTFENPAAYAAGSAIGRGSTNRFTIENVQGKTTEELKGDEVLQALNANRVNAGSGNVAVSSLRPWIKGADGLPKLLPVGEAEEAKSISMTETECTGTFATIEEAKVYLPKTAQVKLQNNTVQYVEIVDWTTKTETITNNTSYVAFTGRVGLELAGIGNSAGISTLVTVTVSRPKLLEIQTPAPAKQTGSYDLLSDVTSGLPASVTIMVEGETEARTIDTGWSLASEISEFAFGSTKGDYIFSADFTKQYWNPSMLKFEVAVQQQGGWEGNGTADNPWLIQTPEDLKMLSDKHNLYSQIPSTLVDGQTIVYSQDNYFLQTADIDLSQYSNWRAVAAIWGAGKKCGAFAANYNGGGHEVSNLQVTSISPSEGYVYASLFGRTYQAVIRNLGVSGSIRVGGNEVGGLVSYAYKSTIVNCYSNVDVTNTDTTATQYGCAGVFAGRADASVIINCYSYGKAACVIPNRAGLFVGRSQLKSSEIINCFYATDIRNAESGAATSAVGSDSVGFALTNVTGKTVSEMKDGSMLTALNQNRAAAASITGISLSAIYPWSTDGTTNLPALTPSEDPALVRYEPLKLSDPEIAVFASIEDVVKLLPKQITMYLSNGETVVADISGWTADQKITPAVKDYELTAKVEYVAAGVRNPNQVAAPTVRFRRAEVMGVSLPTYEYYGKFNTLEGARAKLPATVTAELDSGETAQIAVTWTTQSANLAEVGKTYDFTGTVDYDKSGVQNSNHVTDIIRVKLTSVVDKAFEATLYQPNTSLIAPPAVIADRVADAAALAQQNERPQYMFWYVDASLNLRTAPDGEPVDWSVLADAAGKILPVFYIQDIAAAEGLVQKLNQNLSWADACVCSADPALVKKVCDGVPYVRGMVDYRGAEETLENMACTANENHAKQILLSEKQATSANIRKLQKLLMTVWVDSSASHTMILRGADGIISSTPEHVLTAIQSYSGTPVANRPAMVIAHRGVHNTSDLPENSLAAIRKACEQGMDGVEIDIYMTSDGHLVVNHNSTTDAMFNGNLTITSSTLAQLKALSFKTKADEKIPTVNEVLELVKTYPDVTLVIEIKDERPEVLTALKDLLNQHEMYGQVVVIAYSRDVLKDMRSILPQISTADLNTLDASKRIKEVYASLQPVNAVYNPTNTAVDAALMKAARLRGLPVFPWTVNDSVLDQRYLEGFTAMTSDTPLNYASVPLALLNTVTETRMTKEDSLALTAENKMRVGENQKAETGLTVKTLSGPELLLNNGLLSASENGSATYLVGQSLLTPSSGASYLVYAEPASLEIGPAGVTVSGSASFNAGAVPQLEALTGDGVAIAAGDNAVSGDYTLTGLSGKSEDGKKQIVFVITKTGESKAAVSVTLRDESAEQTADFSIAGVVFKADALSGQKFDFSLTNVMAGSYTVEVYKKNHTVATMTGVKVADADVALGQEMQMFAGDLNGDNRIEGQDFSELMKFYNSQHEELDLNDDGNIEGQDFSTLMLNYNKTGVHYVYGG